MPDFDDNDEIQGYNPWRAVQYKEKIASLKSIPEWLQKPSLPALPWLRRSENVQTVVGERPTLGQRIGATIGQRMARMYGPTAASVPNAAPVAAPIQFDPSKLPDGIRPQPDELEDGEYG